MIISPITTAPTTASFATPAHTGPVAPFELSSTSAPPATDAAAVKFEAVVLRTFVEAMLPREGFGEGTAGHMWRGQMAEALADTLACSGGVGLAAYMEKHA